MIYSIDLRYQKTNVGDFITTTKHKFSPEWFVNKQVKLILSIGLPKIALRQENKMWLKYIMKISSGCKMK